MTQLQVNWPGPGRYIVAVSGGADSLAMLDMLAGAANARGYHLVIAHFDHGMRAESPRDLEFVNSVAGRFSLQFESQTANLAGASEAAARHERYLWLEQVRRRHSADAVITAHHQDDLIETSLLHLARGTGRRGLAPMQSGAVLRPLLAVSRSQLRDYLHARTLTWREDKSNRDIANPRNFIRHVLLPAASNEWRQAYLAYIHKMVMLNKEIEQSMSIILGPSEPGQTAYSFSRTMVRDLSILEAEELIASSARALDPTVDLDNRVVSEVALYAKTGRPGTRRPLRKHLFTGVQTDNVRVYYMGI